MTDTKTRQTKTDKQIRKVINYFVPEGLYMFLLDTSVYPSGAWHMVDRTYHECIASKSFMVCATPFFEKFGDCKPDVHVRIPILHSGGLHEIRIHPACTESLFLRFEKISSVEIAGVTQTL